MNRTSLVIPVFNPTSMAGLYQFVVSSQAGVTIVGEWIVREPGEQGAWRVNEGHGMWVKGVACE